MPNMRCRWNSRFRSFNWRAGFHPTTARSWRFISANGSGVADDVDGDPVFLAKNEFYLGYTKERAEGITFSSIKDVKKKA